MNALLRYDDLICVVDNVLFFRKLKKVLNTLWKPKNLHLKPRIYVQHALLYSGM